MIALNKPVIAVLNSIQWFHIPKKVLSYYEELNRTGIFYKDFKSAALAVNRISKNCDEWWFNKKRQKVLSKFRKKFAKYSNNVDKDFVQQINKIENC